MALSGQTLDGIARVYSHPQALAQCDAYLRQHGLEPVPYYDTAGSAKMIQEQQLTGAAAIASRRAAQLYHLEILAQGIESNPNITNYTGPPYQLAPRGAIPCDPRFPQTPHVGGMLAGLGDGSVRTVAPTISQWTFAAACTPAGQETLPSDW